MRKLLVFLLLISFIIISLIGISYDYELIDDNINEVKQIDSDNDGFSDSYERKNRMLDPNRKDIIIEVDYQEGLDKPNYRDIRSEFRQAPVSNPNSTGIDLHIIYDNSIDIDNSLNNNDNNNKISISGSNFNRIVNKNYDYKNKGYYYALVVENNYFENKNYSGFANSSIDAFVIESHSNKEIQNILFMHEIGHLLGLDNKIFDGVDSNKYNRNIYNSVMNYNNINAINNNGLSYSNSSPFNDWRYISYNLEDNNPRNTNSILYKINKII